MNKKLSLAVASAVMAFGASAANAGIIIPAGDWTLDIGGVVNAYYTETRTTGKATGAAPLGIGSPSRSTSNITTGLLPNYLSVSGKTRENDLDVGFTISINPGASTTQGGKQSAQQENRQAFLTFGDKSWGSIKLGKDLGIFASDAILNDMTLLGVGSGAGGLAGNTTTLGRIGTGFMYADWKSQVAYTSPDWNGFNFTAGVTQAWNSVAAVQPGFTSARRGGASPAFEGKASYSWAGDFAGKVWVSGIHQKVDGANDSADAVDIGANVNVAGFGLTGYYYDGSGIGQTIQLFDGFDAAKKSRDSNGGYVQATYVIPTGTKLGISWGESNLDHNGGADAANGDVTDKMWTIGAYHPLTKHLNLVAEYSDSKHEVGNSEGKAKTVSLGAILFF
ncbi:MAG TPA: porin [Methylophilaceae bacterium]